MEINEYKVFADECFRDTQPPCGAVCPLAYDVREFIKLMQRGSARSAYRLYRNSVIFPALVSAICPGNCEGACVRAQLPGDSAISLKGLEQALVKKMAGKKPERFAIPKKTTKMTIVGGGAAGLACAYRLSSFGYDVTVYEKEESLGGFMKTQIDPEFCHSNLMLEFTSVNVNFVLGQEITDLQALEADAIYLATGESEELFPVGEGDSRVFCASLDSSETVIEAIARGLRAATALEDYTKVGSRNYDPAPVRGKADQRYYHLDYTGKEKEPVPGKGEPEAYRCFSCNCDACMQACPLMEKEKMFPKRMCNETILTLKPNMSKRTSVRMLMGCTDCGQCREVCPEHIDMGKCLENARIDFYESGAMSPAFHDFWLQDMEFSLSDEASFLVKQKEGDCDVLFFPGCQLGASNPEYVIKAYEAVCKGSNNAGLFAGCCGIPALWAGQTAEAEKVTAIVRSTWEFLGKPKVVTACPTCLKSLRRSLGDGVVGSLYGDGVSGSFLTFDSPLQNEEKSVVTVLDPCASAEDRESQQAVRQLLKAAGYQVANEETDIGCCGFGGHIVTSVPELQKKFAQRRINQKEGILVSYCANCRDVFANEGADARHVLGLLLGIDDAHRLPPDLDERRNNRRLLKKIMTSGVDTLSEAGTTSETDEISEISLSSETASEVPQILISRAILDKMNRELILREEVEKTILEAENEKSMILDEDDNLCYAHKRFSTTTVWVVYCKAGDEIQVTNVYVHRVNIREDD